MTEVAGGRVVREDVACAGCGYNLRTLREDGACPECGLGVAETVCERAMWWGDPAWVRRVIGGMRLSSGVYGATVTAALVGMVVGNVVPGDVVATGMFAVMALCAGCGGWLVSLAEPGRDEMRWLRRAVRGLSVALAIALAAMAVEASRLVPWVGILARGTVVIVAGLAGAQGVALLWYGRRLAARATGRRPGLEGVAATLAPAVGWWALAWTLCETLPRGIVGVMALWAIPVMLVVAWVYQARLRRALLGKWGEL